MEILVNEQAISVPDGSLLHEVRDRCKPGADVLVVDGAPATQDVVLTPGARVVFICRGETPSASELQALMAARHTPGVHARVRHASVGIAGAGGLGSTVALALARLGIGTLIVADCDVVEPSNLNRQQYFVDQLGLPKVTALRENLRRANPAVEVLSHHVRLDAENVPRLFGAVDVLVEALDGAEAKAMLVEAFRLGCPGRPLVAASGLAGSGPANAIVTRQVGHAFYLVGDGLSGAVPGRGLMAPLVGVAANHQANCVLRLLLGVDPVGEET